MIRNPIPWPNGAKCAVAITFDMDADSLIHIAKPKDSYDRLYPISMGRYGPLVALPRILDTYERLGLKQSFFIPGWCIETSGYVSFQGGVLKHTRTLPKQSSKVGTRSATMVICMKTLLRREGNNANGLSKPWRCTSAYVDTNRAATGHQFITSHKKL